METIEEAAKNSFDRLSIAGAELNWIDFKGQFMIGVAFAQRWISVEEETPLAVETGEWDGKRSDFVLAKNKWGNVYIARTYEGIIDGNKFCDFAEKDDTIISHIVEWRPIELK